jgi:hypothetical protein
MPDKEDGMLRCPPQKDRSIRKAFEDFLSPDNETNVPLVGTPTLATPQTSSPSDCGLHCGGLIQFVPIDPRLRVCAGSLMVAV